MNCLDCGLPMLGYKDRHRTGDQIQCNRVMRWNNLAQELLEGTAKVPDNYEEQLLACLWHAVNYVSGQDDAFDFWAKNALCHGGPSNPVEVYPFVVHAESVMFNSWNCDENAPDVMKASLRRLAVEVAMNHFLGGHEQARHRITDYFEEALALKVTLKAMEAV